VITNIERDFLYWLYLSPCHLLHFSTLPLAVDIHCGGKSSTLQWRLYYLKRGGVSTLYIQKWQLDGFCRLQSDIFAVVHGWIVIVIAIVILINCGVDFRGRRLFCATSLPGSWRLCTTHACSGKKPDTTDVRCNTCSSGMYFIVVRSQLWAW
jgi:hypothetical protein